MATKIRLTRMGKKRDPLYRIVVTDSQKTRDGQYIEKLGQYSPKATELEKKVVLNAEQAKKWLKLGAQPTLQVRNLLSELKVLETVESESDTKKKKNKRKSRNNPIANRTKKEAPKAKTKVEKKPEKVVAPEAEEKAVESKITESEANENVEVKEESVSEATQEKTEDKKEDQG